LNATGIAQHRRPLWLAALAAALSVPAFYAVLVVALAERAARLHHPPYWGESGAQALGASVFFALPVSAGAMLFLGLPAVFMLRSLEVLLVPHVCIAAAFTGASALGVLTLGSPLAASALPWGATYGLAAGVVFCAVAGIRWRKPA
jgi:hypothetical protein